mmetsp:Transcript_8208/g.26090  ORF Transcript_8208/g.26090 Transcript_8208/m.26090 type:complete len:275 (-) Transcript_8208:193-1017(-)
MEGQKPGTGDENLCRQRATMSGCEVCLDGIWARRLDHGARRDGSQAWQVRCLALAQGLPRHERLLELVVGDVVEHPRLADAHGQGQTHAHRVLDAVIHGFLEEVPRQERAVHRHGAVAKQVQDPVPLLFSDVAQDLRQHCHEGHVGGHSLSVHQLVLGAERAHLQVLPNSVAKVDQAVQVVLPEIRCQLLKHRLDGQAQDPRTSVVRAVLRREAGLHEPRSVLLQQLKELLRLHNRHLAHLTEAVCDLPSLLRPEEGGVQQGRHRGHIRAEAVL